MTEQTPGAGPHADEAAVAVPAQQRRGILRGLWRAALRSLLLLLVCSALYVTGGRLLMPVLTTQTHKVEERLGQLLGTQVRIASLKGSWYRFSPSFAVGGLTLQLDPDDPATRFAIEGGELSLDLWSTLSMGRLALGHVELRGLELSLQQGDGGRWSLRGLPPGERDYKDLILDLLLKTPHISLSEATVMVVMQDGRQFPLQSVFLELENDGRAHELSLQFRMGTRGSPQRAMVQLLGDPRRTFRGQAWVSLDALDLREQLASLLPSGWQLDAVAVDADAWADFDQRGLRSVRTVVDNLQLRLADAQGQRFDIANLALQLGAWPETLLGAQGQVWQLSVQDLVAGFNDVLLAPGRLNLRLPLAADASWTLQAERLDLGTVAALAAALPLPEQAQAALAELAPTGQLGPLVLESNRSGDYPGGFLLRTAFRDVDVQAWRNAPAGTGLDGYAEVAAGRGFAAVDSRAASIHLPGLFRAPWQYERINARVAWELGEGELRVSSTPIAVSSAALQGRVKFRLHNTGMGTDDFRSELDLAVGMDWMDVSVHGDYLPTLQRTADTMRWLDSALVSGRIVDSAFVLRNSSGRRTELNSLTHSSWYRVENAGFRFLEDWPLVEIASAGVLVQDESSDVISSESGIAGINVTRVNASVRPLEAGGAQLQLAVEGLADTATGLDFLRSTPVREQVGAALDDWTGSGNLQLDVRLQQPLGAARGEQQLVVLARAMDASLDIRPYQLDIDGINGNIRYDHSAGLQAEALTGRLFGEPVTLAIQTNRATRGRGRSLRISGTGSADTRSLALWEGQPEFVRDILAFTQGRLDYTAQLDLPAGGGSTTVPRLQLRSDLKGVATSLPAPFDKTADAARSLQLDLRFTDSAYRELGLRFEDWLAGQLVLGVGTDVRGQLYLGSLERDFNIRQSGAIEPGILVSGRLPTFDYDAWSEVAARFSADAQPHDAGLRDYLRLVDVDVGLLRVVGQELEDIGVELRPDARGWQINGRNQTLAGTFDIPVQTGEPWQLHFEYLRFPPRPERDPDAEQPPEEVDLLEDVDPASLPAFAFRTDEFSVGSSNLGTWSFDLEPQPGGARISNLRMQEAASRIAGADEDSGAAMTWQYEAGVHRSSFDGVFAAGDLARVMPKWGHDANIVSRQARFVSALHWPGSPLAFTLKKASGDITMAIDSGRFVDIDSGSSRLLGAFNFDSLVRRLELDFSDLYQRGFAFDTIRGELGFTDGVVNTRRPLVIDGPSSRINIEGEINLQRETIAADMLVRIPLGENISMLAGLLGAWPIALSTYLASKIFADQVEDFTTILYRLEGPWSNPQAGFEPPEDVAVPAAP